MAATKERIVRAHNGWQMLAINLAQLVLGLAMTIAFANSIVLIVFGILLMSSGSLLLCGHFTLQPNEARVLVLFGEYRGTVAESGFYWANPFLTRVGMKISLRARNFDGGQLKVNDLRGNPIEISAVVVWRVVDTAKAKFDVDDYVHFVKVQSESALRHMANDYPYDHAADSDEDVEEITLRSGTDEVSAALRTQLQERLLEAGVEVQEARLNHLAYAPEIAGAMLRRQQAEAIISARRKIVHGAVSMVQMALDDLESQKVIALDDERKAAMVSNLLVILCGETDAQPVINTGTLYH